MTEPVGITLILTFTAVASAFVGYLYGNGVGWDRGVSFALDAVRSRLKMGRVVLEEDIQRFFDEARKGND